MEKKAEQDGELKRRIEVAEDRKNRFLAETVERSVKLARQEITVKPEETRKRKPEEVEQMNPEKVADDEIPVAT